MNIFVTVGFENFAFNRLIQVIDESVGKKLLPPPLLIQTGHSSYQPRFCPWQRFLPFAEILSYLDRADIVVSHGGVGTTLLALSLGKIPILFPRQAKYHEHVDDHQQEFVRKMVEQEKILAAYEVSDLIHVIRSYDSLVSSLHLGIDQAKPPGLREHLEKLLCSYLGGEERSK